MIAISLWTDKRKYIDGLAEIAEQAARVGNMKGLSDTTKKMEAKGISGLHKHQYRTRQVDKLWDRNSDGRDG